jgi:Transposase
MGEEITSKIVFICSDMWEPYLKVIREICSEALHILDRFHIVAKMNKALDEVRAGESRRMAHRAQEEDRSVSSPAPGTDPQLLPGAKNDFQRGRGGLEQQGESHPEKILWLSHLPGARTLPISLAWQAA